MPCCDYFREDWGTEDLYIQMISNRIPGGVESSTMPPSLHEDKELALHPTVSLVLSSMKAFLDEGILRTQEGILRTKEGILRIQLRVSTI